MISYEIVDDGQIVLINKTVNSVTETLEVAKPFRVDLSGGDILTIRDSLNQKITIKRSEVTSPSSTDIHDLEAILLAYNNTNMQSPIIAQLLNVNLKNELPNVLQWLNDKLASNTFPQFIAVKWVSGNYVEKVIPETRAAITIVVNSTLPSSSDMSVLLDGTLIHKELNYTAATRLIKTQKINDILTDAGYTCVQTDATFTIVATAPIGAGSGINGKHIYVNNNPGTTDYISTSANVFAGGITAGETDFDLKLNGQKFYLGGEHSALDYISTLTSEKKVCSSLNDAYGYHIFPDTGDWALPVTTGTQDDFVINIYILGGKI